MKTKHLLTGLVLPALFAACTAEEIETSKGVLTQEDLSARPAVGSVVLNFGETGSRAELGENSFNSIKFNADEDAIGARIIDTYAAAGVEDADEKRVAWYDYTIVDEYASSNYQYVYNGKSWETSALMVEGNYMFYFPYNKKNVSRGPLEIITPIHQTVKPNEDGGERNAIAELYAGENPAFVGYKFIAAENQGLTQNVEMQHLFAYPQITLVNDFLVKNKKGDKVETDLTISKVVLSADNLYAKYIVNHTNFRKNLTEEVSYLAKSTDEEETPCIEAGDWTDAESFLKKASIESITAAQAEGAKTVEITVEFEDGLELAFGEEYSFNVVLPATTFNGGALTMKVYTDDDMMIGTKTIDETTEETLYNEALFNNAKKMSFAPGKRYSTQEYNFPNVGNPTPKKSAGNSGIYELGGENLCLIDAVAPVAVINTIEEFEAFLETIDKNVNDLVEITKATERKANENNFILTPAYDEKGNKLDYANLAVDEAFLALLDEYNYNGTIEFVSKMNILGAAEAPSAEDEIEEFLLGSDDYEMTFADAVVKNGYVTVNEYTEITNLVVENGLVTVKGDDEAAAAIAATTVKGGELKITSALFDPSTVTASYALNAAGNAVVSNGKVTLNYTGETKAAKIEGHATLAGAGTLEIGTNVVIKEMASWTKGTVVNNGKITGAVTVPAAGTLTNNGKMEGTITNNGIITANKNMTVATNNGKIVNTIAGKVVNTANQQVYATITSLKNNGVDAANVDALVKYDTHAAITRFVITGEWEVDKNIEATDLATLKNKEIEFASGSSLYVHNATLAMPGQVIVTADVNWSGRDASNAKVELNNITNPIVYTKKANSTAYNNLTVTELTITKNSTSIDVQEILLNEVAKNGGTVTLTGDVDLASTINFEKDATVNLNGKNVGLALNTTSVYGSVFVSKAGTLTISGNGVVDGGTDDNASGSYRNAVVADGGDVVINGGTYTINQGTNALIYAKKGDITINGGEFSAETINAAGPGTKDAYCLLNCLDSNYKIEQANIIVKGGKFTNFNPAVNYAEKYGEAFTSFVHENYKVKVTEYGTGKDLTTTVHDGKTFAEQAFGSAWTVAKIYSVVAK